MTMTSDSLTISLPVLSPGVLAFAGGTLAVVILVTIVFALRNAGIRREEAEEANLRAAESEARLAELLKIQAEMQGRISTMAEVFGSRQAELNHAINQRLDGMTQRMSSTLTEQTKSTHDNLQKLQE